MELKDFIKKLLNFWPGLLVFLVLGLIAGLIFNFAQKPSFKTQVLIYFAPTGQSQILSTATEFTDTILGILGNQNYQSVSLRPRKIAPQIVEFRITASTKETAQKTAENLSQNFKLRLDKTLGENQVALTVLTPQVDVNQSPNLLILNLLVGALAGFALGVSIFSTRIYFKS